MISSYLEKNKPISQDRCAEILRGGGIGVLPTDTLYGLVCRAEDAGAVERLYRTRKRSPDKAGILLIADMEDVERFGVVWGSFERRVAYGVWPGPVSVIFPCREERFFFLHRGTNSLAFRIPNDTDLVDLLQKTGPLLVPSANFEGQPVAETVSEAREIFGETVDFYADGGKLSGPGSTLIACDKNDIVLRREGRISFEEILESVQ